MKVGDRVRITKAQEPYFSIGDEAILLCETDGGWDADFSINDSFYKDGLWFISTECGIAECELVEETKDDDQFVKELENLINRYSKENDSDTPDFILARYMHNCLLNFNSTMKQRSIWHDNSVGIDDIDDPCPQCNTQLKTASGGGVKCPNCNYWFCF